MRRRSNVLAALVVGAGVFTLTPAAGAVTGILLRAPQPAPALAGNAPVAVRLPPDRYGRPAPVPAGQRADAPAGPRLDRAQVGRAARLLRGSPQLARLSQGAGYRITSSVPWTPPDSERVSGAYVTVRLARAFSGDVTLPGVRYDATGAGYTVLQLRERIAGANGLSVLVSFDRGAVVGVEPDADARVTGLAGNSTSAARGE